MKQFMVKLGWDFLEVLMIVGFGILMFPLMIKAMWWVASLFGYDLV